MLSTERYKGEEEMIPVLTPTGRGQACPPIAQEKEWPEGIPLDVYVSGVSGLGLRAPETSGLSADRDPVKEVGQNKCYEARALQYAGVLSEHCNIMIYM